MGTVLVAVVLSLLMGFIGGFAAGMLTGPKAPAPQTRELWVFTVVLPFDDVIVGQPHDYFAPDQINVNKGDTVTIHFYNTEDEAETHTFTLDSPYTDNHSLNMGQNTTFTFTANAAGVFAYRCTLHQPTMTGYLVVNG